MSFMTEKEIRTIENRCNQLSNEKWEVCKVVIGNVVFYDVAPSGNTQRPYTKQECEFIAHAKTDIKQLIEHIYSLQALLRENQQVKEAEGF
jgi:hypothetical protein